MYTIFFQPLGFPQGEYTYACEDEQRLVATYRAMQKLAVDFIDVEREGESLTAAELEELLAE